MIDASSRRDLGAVAMGAAVKEGARKPDISTPEALKQTLAEAKSLKVARGEVEIAFHQMTEMLPVKGVTVIGPLPPELPRYSAAQKKKAMRPRPAGSTSRS